MPRPADRRPPLTAIASTIAAHRTVALQKNGGVKTRRNPLKFQENSVVFYAILCGGLLQREGHFFVALLQPA